MRKAHTLFCPFAGWERLSASCELRMDGTNEINRRFSPILLLNLLQCFKFYPTLFIKKIKTPPGVKFTNNLCFKIKKIKPDLKVTP